MRQWLPHKPQQALAIQWMGCPGVAGAWAHCAGVRTSNARPEAMACVACFMGRYLACVACFMGRYLACVACFMGRYLACLASFLDRYLACLASFLDRYLAGRNGPGLTCDVGTAASVGERAHAGGR